MKKNNKASLLIVISVVLLIGGLLIFLDNGLTGDSVKENPNPALDTSLKGNPDKVTIYFFWGNGCPHCATEKPYLEEWQEKYGDKIEVKMFEIYENPENVPLFQQVASVYGIEARGVPATFIGEESWIGFSSSMAPEIEGYIQECLSKGCESPLD